MNGQHLRAFLWLRWRLRANQFKKGGVANAVIWAIVLIGAALLSISLFVTLLLTGIYGLANSGPNTQMYIWDGMAAGFLFCWAAGLLVELQRSEVLSLDRFLHLPVSLSSAFLINYVSTLFGLTTIVFVPAMLGLALGLIISKGPSMLLLLPLVAAFLLMVTALSYQFQGWLASLMANKRRRRTIIVLVTGGFVLLAQLPNLLTSLSPLEKVQTEERELRAQQAREEQELVRSRQLGHLSLSEFEKRQEASKAELAAQLKGLDDQTKRKVARTARFANMVFPPGWLALGALWTAEGQVAYAGLAVLGLTLIGVGSLRRGYRTTLRLYTGQYSSGAAAKSPTQKSKPPSRFLERKLPWLSEQATIIALGGFRSILRAPEAKMMLLTPLIMLCVFGGSFLRKPFQLSEATRPLLAFAALGLIFLSMDTFVGNQFGFDRNGFRVFVLCPARRRDILLGKNLAIAPIALGLGWLLITLVQILYPLRLDYLLALLPQSLSMYLLFCLLGNCVSILVPIPIAAGAMRPTNVRVVPVLIRLLAMLLLPVTLSPTLLPLAAQVWLEGRGWPRELPICLILSLIECVLVVGLYRWLLTFEGQLLQVREQKILEIVRTKSEG